VAARITRRRSLKIEVKEKRAAYAKQAAQV
jgi:hypothetical protein